MKLPIPANEDDRVAAVEGLRILETAPEPEFDELAHLAARICGTPIAQINLVTTNHAWAKSNIGFPDKITKRSLSVCGLVVGTGQPVVIPDTHQDERSSLLPMVVQGPKVRFYAGVPLILKGRVTVGTLCVMDTKVRSLELEQLGALQTLARQVVAHLELRRVLKPAETGGIAGQRQARQVQQTEHLGMMADQIPAAVWSVDTELRFTSAFGAAIDAIGMTPAQVLGRTLIEHLGTDSMAFPPFAAHVRALKGESPGPMRWHVGDRTFEVHVEPLTGDDGELVGAAGVAVDITERTKMEATVVEAESRVRDLAEQVTGSVKIGEGEGDDEGGDTVVSLVT